MKITFKSQEKRHKTNTRTKTSICLCNWRYQMKDWYKRNA